MNFYNLLVGLGLIGIGIVLNVIMIFPMIIYRKKLNSFWKILILLLIVFLGNAIANFLMRHVPEDVMPHCLACMTNSVGYIWDKNEIRDITVIINCILGIFWSIYIGATSVAQIVKKNNKGDNILLIIWSIVSILIIGFMYYYACSWYYR